jgi:hypothetical protein
MRMRDLSLVLAVSLSGCVRHPHPYSTPTEDDPSITFPQFFAQDAIEVGAGGALHELDGAMLRALMIVANDFAPPSGQDLPCWRRQEANTYRAIRQDGIVFVYVREDHQYCGRPYPSFDSGAKYAISHDGRILRRVLDGQPTGLFEPTPLDGGDIGEPAEPGVLPGSDASVRGAADAGPLEWSDGGTGHSLPESPPAPPSKLDGGYSGARKLP